MKKYFTVVRLLNEGEEFNADCTKFLNMGAEAQGGVSVCYAGHRTFLTQAFIAEFEDES